MKIDTSKIPNFSDLPENVRDAITAMELPDMSQFVAKATFDKKAAEAADLSKKLREHMTEDEQKKQEQEDKLTEALKELEQLRTEKTVSEYTAKFVSQGYDETLATDTAKAMASGDAAKVFANQQKFLDGYTKRVRAEILKNTPVPQGGGASQGMDYAKKIAEAQASGDVTAVAYYTRLQAQENKS